MNVTDINSNRSVISPSPLQIPHEIAHELVRVPRNHGVKFGENRITFNPSPHIKSPLEIHVYVYK